MGEGGELLKGVGWLLSTRRGELKVEMEAVKHRVLLSFSLSFSLFVRRNSPAYPCDGEIFMRFFERRENEIFARTAKRRRTALY